MRVTWHPVLMHSYKGQPGKVDSKYLNSDPTLLQRIQAMPPGRPITFALAYDLYWHDIFSQILDDDGTVDAAGEISNTDWVKWTSMQGYQIILDGSEYTARLEEHESH